MPKSDSEYVHINGYFNYVIDNSYQNTPKYDSWFPIKHNSQTANVTDDLLLQITQSINETEEKVKQILDDNYDLYNSVVPFSGYPVDRVVIYDGINGTLEDVCEASKEYCSPLTAQKLMNQDYMYSIEGKIYHGYAKGKNYPDKLDLISRDDIVSVDGNKIVLKVKRAFNGTDQYYTYSYTVLAEDNNVYILDYDILEFVDLLGRVEKFDLTQVPFSFEGTDAPVTDDVHPSLEDADYIIIGGRIIDNSYKKSKNYDSWYPITYDSNAKIDITDVHLELMLDKVEAMKTTPLWESSITWDPKFGSYLLEQGRFVNCNDDNFTLEAVCDRFNDICSPLALQKMMNQDNYVSIEGKIHTQAAAGAIPFILPDGFVRDDIVSVDGNMVKIKAHALYNGYVLTYSYTFLVNGDDVYVLDYDLLSVASSISYTEYYKDSVPLDKNTFLGQDIKT